MNSVATGLNRENCYHQDSELTQSSLTSDQKINVNYNRVNSQPLCVDVSIVGYPFNIYDCLVDNETYKFDQNIDF